MIFIDYYYYYNIIIILLQVLLLFGVILFILDRNPGKHGLANIIIGETRRFNNITIWIFTRYNVSTDPCGDES